MLFLAIWQVLYIVKASSADFGSIRISADYRFTLASSG
jgi:hypothetical protein